MGWNDGSYETYPNGSSSIANVDDQIRSLKTNIRGVVEKEHYLSEGGTDANFGQHKEGSARCFFAGTSDDVSLLSKPTGSIWLYTSGGTQNDSNEIRIYSGTGWENLESFPGTPEFPDGLEIVPDSGSAFILGGSGVSFTGGFVGVDGGNRLICNEGFASTGGVTNAVQCPVDGGFMPSSAGTDNVGSSDSAFSEIHGNKVYGAVGNDFADEIEGAPEEVIYGRCYAVVPGGEIQETSKYAQKGTLGVASNTASFTARNEKIEGNKVPIAVGGFVLAYVDRDYIPGTALVSTRGGVLTKAGLLTKVFFPERIVGWFVKDPGEFWGIHLAHNRFVVKVV